jgi:hypothetical protein
VSIPDALEALGLAIEYRRRAVDSDDDSRRARLLDTSEQGIATAVRILLPELRYDELRRLDDAIHAELSGRG